MRPDSIDPHWPRPKDVIECHRRNLEALQTVRHLIESGSPSLSGTVFAGLVPKGALARLEEAGQELGQEAAFALLASFDAVLCVEYESRVRVQRKMKDQWSRVLRTLDRQRKPGYRSSLAKAILKKLRPLSRNRCALDRLLQLFDTRDWLAHGRWWSHAEKRPSPEIVWLAGKLAFDSCPGFTSEV